MSEECKHDNRAYCQRTFVNGSIHIGTMCLNCGDFRAVKKDSIPLPERNNLREFDPSIRDRYQESMRVAYREEAATRRENVIVENRSSMNEYYSSPQWKEKRKYRLQLNWRMHYGLCEVCSKNKATDIHHITYERFGNEWLLDLAAVCSSCHVSYHPHMQGD
jgi:hypothetical protein